MGRVAATFSTSLLDVRALYWDDALLWANEAPSIWKETWGRKGS